MKNKNNWGQRLLATVCAGGLWLLSALTGFPVSVRGAEEAPVTVTPASATSYTLRLLLTRPGETLPTPTTDGAGNYTWKNLALNVTDQFYVTDDSGTTYNQNGRPLSVDQTGRYDIRFAPTASFDQTHADVMAGWASTNCHVTYRLTAAEVSYTFQVSGATTVASTPMTYNVYQTGDPVYVAEDVYLRAGVNNFTFTTAGSTVTDSYTAENDGFYRVQFSPDQKFTVDGDDHYLLVEVATLYYLQCVDQPTQLGATSGTVNIGGVDYYPLTRDLSATTARYQSPDLFFAFDDNDALVFSYRVYDLTAYRIAEKQGTTLPAPVLINDDLNDDTATSSWNVRDVGWYRYRLTDTGTYLRELVWQGRAFGDYYLATATNSYGYNLTDGSPIYPTAEKFTLSNNSAEADYDEYTLNFTVTDNMLRAGRGEVSFYITNGTDVFQDSVANVGRGDNLGLTGLQKIKLTTAQTYQIKFTPDGKRPYGNRAYQITEKDAYAGTTVVKVGDVDTFLAVASRCVDADYSVHLVVELTADLDFGGRALVPVRYFAGRLEGNYRTIRNLRYADSFAVNGTSYTAVFGELASSAVLCNLTIANLQLGDTDRRNVALVGTNSGTMRDVTVAGTWKGDTNVAGIVANNQESGVITDCALVGDSTVLDGKTNVGGLVASNAGKVERAQSEAGKVFGKLNVGGLVGTNTGKVIDSHNRATVAGTNDSQAVGGVVGLSSGPLYFDFNDGTVNGKQLVGGIAGSFTGATAETQIWYCLNRGTVMADDGHVGGLVGSANDQTLSIVNCASVATVTVRKNTTLPTAGVGGLVGTATGVKIRGCLTAGYVHGVADTAQNIGGLVGYAVDTNIIASASAMTVSGSAYLGGIVGQSVASVDQSGTVNTTDAQIIGCYANVLLVAKESENCGAIAGRAEGFSAVAGTNNQRVKANYYVSSPLFAGLGGNNYGTNFNAGAQPVAGNVLATQGALASVLSADFQKEAWQGGADHVAYPQPIYFFREQACSAYGDDTAWTELFDAHQSVFRAVAEDATVVTYTVVFRECQKDQDVYDAEQNLLTENFALVGEPWRGTAEELATLTTPAPVNYTVRDAAGRYLFDDGIGRYAVTFPAVTVGETYQIVDAVYTRLQSTLKVANGEYLLAGDFVAGTEARLESVGGYARFVFTRDGAPVAVGKYTVKWKNATGKIVLAKGGVETVAKTQQSGQYLTFTLNDDGTYFRLDETADGLPAWAWGAIGAGCGLAVGLVAVILLKLKRKKSA